MNVACGWRQLHNNRHCSFLRSGSRKWSTRSSQTKTAWQYRFSWMFCAKSRILRRRECNTARLNTHRTSYTVIMYDVIIHCTAKSRFNFGKTNWTTTAAGGAWFLPTRSALRGDCKPLIKTPFTVSFCSLYTTFPSSHRVEAWAVPENAYTMGEGTACPWVLVRPQQEVGRMSGYWGGGTKVRPTDQLIYPEGRKLHISEP